MGNIPKPIYAGDAEVANSASLDIILVVRKIVEHNHEVIYTGQVKLETKHFICYSNF